MFKLEELKRQDLPIINKWRNNQNLINFLGAPFRYINLEVDEAWFEYYMSNRKSCVRCSIFSNDKLIGLVSLTNIDTLNQTCIFHIMIGETTEQNKGAGTFAIKEILNHAFLNLNIRKVKIEVLESNARAIKLYEKVGFVFEGRERKAVYKHGHYEDLLIYGIFKEEYLIQTKG